MQISSGLRRDTIVNFEEIFQYNDDFVKPTECTPGSFLGIMASMRVREYSLL
ncbi:MAG TPA: hypothetical protein HPQ00_03370 [Magnetococcales bacterium]|nr:hypothetical protein [Magnetococcales bacterium]